MGKFDYERWYLMVLGDKETLKFFGTTCVQALSGDDAVFKTSKKYNFLKCVVLQMIYIGEIEPVVIRNLGD